MRNVEKFFEQIEAVETGNYTMKFSEVKALYEKYQHDPFRMVYSAFKYGFLKGKRATKAQMKTKAGVR